MPKYKSSLAVLDRPVSLELVLELLSFAGGENTKGEDAALKSNEARLIENWDSLSIGGMERSKGFNEVADGGAPYTAALDLVAHHKEGTATTRVFGVIAGDLVYKNGAVLSQTDAAAFTSGKLCHAVSAGDKLWITNETDNLKYKTIAGAITVPASVPTAARSRIYHSRFRLLAEGNGKTVYGSRAASGNWTAADAWSLANDAFNIDLPDQTFGMVPGFPSGVEDLIFTYFRTYALFNYPDVAYRIIPNGIGCAAPYTIARGKEGVFFLSNYPTLGIFLYNGVDFIELTVLHDFVEDVNLAQRIFGIYRDGRYYLFYNETGSGVTYPNRVKIYDTRWGRWMSRPVHASLSDNFGYPALLQYDNNELYAGSSQKDKLYELETEDDSAEANATQATYRTKTFSSRDWSTIDGSPFPVDHVRLKLLKMVITLFGTTGNVGVLWRADRGARSGSQTITLSASGDLINSTFTVNTSQIIALDSLVDKTFIRSFANAAIGRFFSFDITNNETGNHPKIRSVKLHALALEEL